MTRLLAFTALLLCFTLTACQTHLDSNAKEYPEMTDSTGLYRHVVVFKFKETATQAHIDEIVQAFGKLQDDIPEIIAYEHGVNVSPEGLDQGFTHVFLVTFKDKAGLEVYLPHPAHQAFVKKLRPLLEQPFVVDYVVE